MQMMIKGKKVTVIGAARSGLAVAKLATQLGALVKISDSKPEAMSSVGQAGLRWPDHVRVEYGGHTRDFVNDSDYVVISPGVRPDSLPVIWAKAAGIEVIGEVEVSARLCPCPIIAVTGSNGKTTTVTLIHRILEKAGRKAVLCGNIGSPLADHVLGLTASDWVVLEISSFQLESCSTFKPRVALWLNFSANHLDRHKDINEYYEAKRRIFACQDHADWAVLNEAQPEFKDLAPTLRSHIIFFNGAHRPAGIENPNYLAALGVAQALCIPPEVCMDVFATFKGVEHRQELVRTLEGVDYINDSKSTTPEAGRWALLHLKKPMIMICGGSDKHLDFSYLRPLVAGKVKHMVVIGETKRALCEAFEGVVPLTACATLPEAVDAARAHAKPGECVVLSPMCASFDMFKDYEHRGREFKSIVSGLK